MSRTKLLVKPEQWKREPI